MNKNDTPATRCPLAFPWDTVINLIFSRVCGGVFQRIRPIWQVSGLIMLYSGSDTIFKEKAQASVLISTCQVNSETAGRRGSLMEISGLADGGELCWKKQKGGWIRGK